MANIIDAPLLSRMIISGANNLSNNRELVDALNVFPVPDGDTGTNMRMTIEAGVDAISSCDDTKIGDMAKKLSRGMLMGARGNSGVILSQLFRGISKGLEGLDEANAVELGKAFKMGVAQAYKAVMTPVEGTILTVAREASEKMSLIANSKMSINEFLDEYLLEAKASLDRTPELLPVLKEAGVVDSGGAGYLCIIEGMRDFLNGKEITDVEIISESNNSNKVDFSKFNENSIMKYGYCTELLLQLPKIKIEIDTFDEILDKEISILDLSKLDSEKLLENFSIVFQDVILFNNTIMENIRIGKKDTSDEEVILDRI